MGYAEKLQKLCALRGLDQSALAERLQISRSSMSRVLAGVQEPKLRTAFELSRLLGVTLDFLLNDELEFDTAAQLALVTHDELTILKIARRLGTNETMDRLLASRAEPVLTENVQAEEPR